MDLTPKVDRKTLANILSTYNDNPDKCYEALVLFVEITSLAYGKEIVKDCDNTNQPSIN